MNKGIVVTVALLIVGLVASSPAGSSAPRPAFYPPIQDEWINCVTCTSVIGDFPPTLPAIVPLESDVITGCVGSDYVVAWVVMGKLTEDPPSSPFGVRANADGYPIPLGSVFEATIEGVCWRGQGFARDGERIAVYKAPCDNPQLVTRVR